MMNKVDESGALILAGFPLYKQETPFSCGPCSARMCLEYLGHEVEEAELRKRARTNKHAGTIPAMLARAYNDVLTELGAGLTARMLTGPAADDAVIRNSLAQGLPIVISFLDENAFRPGTLIGHYSVVYGHDQAEVMIANAFGRRETIALERSWKMVAFDPGGEPMPASMTLGLALRLLARRTMIVLEKRTD